MSEVIISSHVDGAIHQRAECILGDQIPSSLIGSLVSFKSRLLEVRLVPQTQVPEGSGDDLHGTDHLGPVLGNADSHTLLAEDEVLEVGHDRTRSRMVLTSTTLNPDVLNQVPPVENLTNELRPVLLRVGDQVPALLERTPDLFEGQVTGAGVLGVPSLVVDASESNPLGLLVPTLDVPVGVGQSSHDDLLVPHLHGVRRLDGVRHHPLGQTVAQLDPLSDLAEEDSSSPAVPVVELGTHTQHGRGFVTQDADRSSLLGTSPSVGVDGRHVELLVLQAGSRIVGVLPSPLYLLLGRRIIYTTFAPPTAEIPPSGEQRTLNQ